MSVRNEVESWARLPVPRALPTTPDTREWVKVLSLDSGPSRPVPGDTIAIRWHDGWRIAARWREERGGMVCVLENGGVIEVPSPSMILRLRRGKSDCKPL